jgi:hypothetical protein
MLPTNSLWLIARLAAATIGTSVSPVLAQPARRVIQAISAANVRRRETVFSGSFDSKLFFTANDRTFTREGKAAPWTKADSVTRFGALTITTLS